MEYLLNYHIKTTILCANIWIHINANIHANKDYILRKTLDFLTRVSVVLNGDVCQFVVEEEYEWLEISRVGHSMLQVDG